MLPMRFRPNPQGEIVDCQVDFSALDRLNLQHLPQAHAMACDFWERVGEDGRISDDFKRTAAAHGAAVSKLLQGRFHFRNASCQT